MTLPLPSPLVTDLDGILDPVGVQQNFDGIAQQFPLAANATYFQEVPHVRAYRSVDVGIPNNTWTAVTFDAEDYDRGTSVPMHDTVTNTSRFYCRVPGLHDLTANICWEANAVGDRAIQFLVNGGGNAIAEEEVEANGTGNSTQLNIGADWRLAVGDYVEVLVYQNSGGGLNVQAVGAFKSTFLSMVWRSP